MKKVIITATLLFGMVFLPGTLQTNVLAARSRIVLTGSKGPNTRPRMPMLFPYVDYEDHVIYLGRGCTEGIIQLLRDDDVVFQRPIFDGMVYFPILDSLVGEFTIQLVKDDVCYYNTITL